MDGQTLLLSFIVPVYNVEEYLEECLDSLILQDIPYEEYEIICVDDGSTDKSGTILDVYAQKYENIVVVHKENGGVSSARNCGIDIAKGKYIWFVDADDFIRYNCLATLKPLITENHYDIIKILPYSFNNGAVDFSPDKTTPEMSQRNIKNFLWTKILKKTHITENRIYFDTRISHAEDAVFMLQVNEFLENAVTVKENVLYFYRQRPGSAMSQNLNKKISSRLYGALVCDEIIQGKRIGDIEGAYKFKYVSVVKIMELIFKLPNAERKTIEKELKKNNLFPLKYSVKYTPCFRKREAAYVKKVQNTLVDFSYMRIGHFLLCVFFFIKDFLKKLK